MLELERLDRQYEDKENQGDVKNAEVDDDEYDMEAEPMDGAVLLNQGDPEWDGVE